MYGSVKVSGVRYQGSEPLPAKPDRRPMTRHTFLTLGATIQVFDDKLVQSANVGDTGDLVGHLETRVSGKYSIETVVYTAFVVAKKSPAAAA